MIGYGFMSVAGSLATLAMFLQIFIGSRRRARNGTFYSITALYRKNPREFHEDLPKIFALLIDNKIDPLISHMFPLKAAREAIELLASGTVQGKIVLTLVAHQDTKLPT